MNSLQSSVNNIPNILYNGFIEELVDILQVIDANIVVSIEFRRVEIERRATGLLSA